MPSTVKITTLEQLKVALQAAKTYIDNEIGGLGGLAGKSEITYEDLAAALKTLIDGKAEQTTVDTMIGDDTGKSIRAISAEEVAKIVAGADEKLLAKDIYENIIQFFIGSDIVRIINRLVRTWLYIRSENIINQIVNILVRSHLTPFRNTAGCFNHDVLL